MFDVAELNRKILNEIGLDKIAWIAQAAGEDPSGDWECYAAPDEDSAEAFGFSPKEGFKDDLDLYYDHYVIQDSSAYEGMKDVVLIGYGPAYHLYDDVVPTR